MKDLSKLSPMMQQYMEIKNKYPDHIVFFRLGDFYEMFFDDASLVAKELELTLTGRDCGLENRAPMCGVPHHSSEIYIKRLIDKGYRIAICEQTSDPASSKGIVDRDVVRIVTPGTLVESTMLDENKNNYVCSIYINGKSAGISFADMSTGSVHVFEKTGKTIQNDVVNEISRFLPSEILYNDEFLSCKEIYHFIRHHLPDCISVLCEEDNFKCGDNSIILNQFKDGQIDLAEFNEHSNAKSSLCALFTYIQETQKNTIQRFTEINFHKDDEFLVLDFAARRNLELTETIRNKERRGSLLWVLDKTKTSMGKRLLKTYIEQPLTNPAKILKRLDAVEELMDNPIILGEVMDDLTKVYDLERLMSRVVYGIATPRDVSSLAFTARKLPLIKEKLSEFKVALLKEINGNISPLDDIRVLIENSIVEEPPANFKDGGVIKEGFNDELDSLRHIVTNGKEFLSEIEEDERKKTGIKNLKVGYNRVFGYFIEVSKSNIENVPDTYVRKQTLTNAERYITDELKEIETKIIGAKDKSLTLEAEIFAEIKKYIASSLLEVQETAAAIATLDVLCSFAIVSMSNGYHRPDITLDNKIDIKDGRHPVVEAMQTDEIFVPNDTYIDTASCKMIILTGPNMAGKSTYMRQVALIVLMAQLGCFVPAESARIGIVDRIFTRIGASDDLTAGQSTFMVEMSEVADILRYATKRSLVILDEIGRGTSTFDGISIAHAVAEYIATSRRLGCKTLFATHYHELISLEHEIDGIKNFSVAVSKKGSDEGDDDTIKFLRKIVPGGVDDSYGIEVSKLAGIPNSVINRAKELLADMERSSKLKTQDTIRKAVQDDAQIDFNTLQKNKVINSLKALNINELTEDEAKDLLHEIANLS